MKIEVGKYARQGNVLGIITDADVTETQIAIRKGYSNISIILDKSKIKVASTPMGLIEVGDLICEGGFRTFDVTKIENDMIHGYTTVSHIDDITKILKPNSNGGYDLQWESE